MRDAGGGWLAVTFDQRDIAAVRRAADQLGASFEVTAGDGAHMP